MIRTNLGRWSLMLTIGLVAPSVARAQAPFDTHNHASRIWGSPSGGTATTTPMRGLPAPPNTAGAAANPYAASAAAQRSAAGAAAATPANPWGTTTSAQSGAVAPGNYPPSNTVPNPAALPGGYSMASPTSATAGLPGSYPGAAVTSPVATGGTTGLPNAATALPSDLVRDSPQMRMGPAQVPPTTPLAGPTSSNRSEPWSRPGGVGGAAHAGNVPWSGSASTTGGPLAQRGEGADTTAAYKPAAEGASPDASMWVALLAGLFFSLCANGYFIWQAWETHNRYEDLVAELAEDRGSPGPMTSRRRLRERRSLDDDGGDGPPVRSRDESLASS